MTILGLLAGALHVAGVWGVGSRRRGAFLLLTAGSLAWIVHAALALNPGLGLSNAVFVALNLRGWARWKQD